MNVLIVDDNPAICDALSLLLSLHDIPTQICHTPKKALELLRVEKVSLVIQDMNFTADTTSGEEGKNLFYAMRNEQPDLPIILITAWTHLEMAVELVRAGAADYQAKPWDDDKLITSINNLLELNELRQENQQFLLQKKESEQKLAQYDLCGLIYRHSSMVHLLEIAVQVANADISVLVTGANGVGKEKIAEIVQKNSSRRDQPFIKVNAGAIPADLIEAELFGAEAGAYTGANKSRIGRFEAADNGTIFLDEIGNLSLSGQMKLLRVLQTGEFERLGSNRTKKVDVRVISATNSDLKRAVAQGDFREDLYYRLNVVELEIPSLKYRKEDILSLVNFFSGERELDTGAKLALENHDWPGNVRELENAVKRACVLAQQAKLSVEDFGLSPAIPYKEKLTEPSLEEIEQALDDADGVVARAARHLGLSRQALYRRMHKFGMQRT